MATLEKKLNLALIGHGKMGKLIEKHSLNLGHSVKSIITSGSNLQDLPNSIDAAIDFSVNEGIEERIEFFLKKKVPLVVGTTGWDKKIQSIADLTKQLDGAILYSPNFSIGVALYLQLVKRLSELYSKTPAYSLALLEEHHSQKKDSPSGTAIKINETIEANCQRKDKIEIASLRYGSVPGTHTLMMDSPFDTIALSHTARSRDGFAIGAIDAAKWLVGKTGFFTLEDMIKDHYD